MDEYTISTTETSQFRDCRRKWWLSNCCLHPDSNGQLGLESKYPEVFFFFGECVHAGLEAFYRSRKDGESSHAVCAQAASSAFFDSFETKLTELRKEYGSLWTDEAEGEFQELRQLGSHMISNYCMMEFSEPIGGKGAEPEIIEVRHFSDWFICSNGMKARVSGRFDLTIKDKHGWVWVCDHKTAQQKPWIAGIDVDDQLTSYCYLYAVNYDSAPRGAIYNVLLKAKAEIEVLKNGQLSKNKMQKCTFGHYYAAIQNMGLDVSKYSDFLEVLKLRGWSDFFLREGSTRSAAEIQNYEKRLANVLEDVSRCIENPSLAYPNPGQFKCRGCSFVTVCKAMECDDDWESIIASSFRPRSPRA
jgi:hypothetical protein